MPDHNMADAVLGERLIAHDAALHQCQHALVDCADHGSLRLAVFVGD